MHNNTSDKFSADNNTTHVLNEELEYFKKYLHAMSNPKFFEYFSPFVAADNGPNFSLPQMMNLYNAYIEYSMQLPDTLMRFWMPNANKK